VESQRLAVAGGARARANPTQPNPKPASLKKASLEARQAGTLQTYNSRPAVLVESSPFLPGLAQSTATPPPGRTDLSYLADRVARETSESHYLLQPPPFAGGVHLSFHPTPTHEKRNFLYKVLPRNLHNLRFCLKIDTRNQRWRTTTMATGSI
jgi:hypothetical protein